MVAPVIQTVSTEAQLIANLGDKNNWQPFSYTAFNSEIIFQKATDTNGQNVLAFFRLPWGYCLPEQIEKDLILTNFPSLQIIDMGKEARRRDFDSNRNANSLNTRKYFLEDALAMLSLTHIAQWQLKQEIPSITKT